MSNRPPASVAPRAGPQDFCTTSAEQASAYLSELCASPIQVGGIRSGNTFRYTRGGVGRLMLDEVDVPAQLRGSGETPGRVVIMRLRRGRVQRATVADVARAAHVTIRAVQVAFQRHLDTTPMAYLRRVRLELAHADLQAAIPGDDTTVTAVAARWGFAPSQPIRGRLPAGLRTAPTPDVARIRLTTVWFLGQFRCVPAASRRPADTLDG